MRFTLPMLALIASCSFSALASPVDELIELNHPASGMAGLQDRVVRQVLRNSPQLSAYQSTLEQWAEQHITWDGLKPRIAEIYNKYYSEQEIEELLAFYKSPVGKKSLKLSRSLIQEVTTATASLAQAHSQELKTMLDQAKAKQSKLSPAEPEAN